MKGKTIVTKSAPQRQAGSTLVVIIIAIVVVAVLGVGMYTLTSTGQLNQARAQNDAKAYYISESCIRIAASEYKAASNKNETLAGLHGRDFTMPNNQGGCSVYVYPYWFYLPSGVSYSANASPINAHFPGGVPPVERDGTDAISIYTGVRLRLYRPSSPSTNAVAVVNTASIGSFSNSVGTVVTFNLSTPFPVALSAGDIFYLGYSYTSTQTAPNSGGNLILDIPSSDTDYLTAKMFPPEKGSIFVEKSGNVSQYQYDQRIIATNTNPRTVTLTNIRAIPNAPAPLFPVEINNTPIYMAKSLGFRATSQVGN